MVFGSTWREVGVERIHRRVDAERGDVARQHDGRVEVAEGRGGRRVGQVVRRHVHRLDRGDRAGLGRGDALLQAAHFLGQRRLVAHRRGHAAEQRRHFGARERESGRCCRRRTGCRVPSSRKLSAIVEAGERHAQAVAGRLVHLAEHHRHLRFGQVVRLHHLGFDHLVIEVVALARALADAGEHRQARVLGGDVVDQLQHVHGLADAGAAEQADLAALGERADEVDHLDAGLRAAPPRATARRTWARPGGSSASCRT